MLQKILKDIILTVILAIYVLHLTNGQESPPNATITMNTTNLTSEPTPVVITNISNTINETSNFNETATETSITTIMPTTILPYITSQPASESRNCHQQPYLTKERFYLNPYYKQKKEPVYNLKYPKFYIPNSKPVSQPCECSIIQPVPHKPSKYYIDIPITNYETAKPTTIRPSLYHLDSDSDDDYTAVHVDYSYFDEHEQFKYPRSSVEIDNLYL